MMTQPFVSCSGDYSNIMPAGKFAASARTAVEALEKALKLAPDIVILDLAMPGMNGLQSAQQILQINPHMPLLLLSVQQVSRQLAEAARNIGFRGAVTKGNGREVVEGVETVLRGESFFVLAQTEDISA